MNENVQRGRNVNAESRKPTSAVVWEERYAQLRVPWNL